MNHDLTRGSVTGSLVRFAIPLFFANVLQSCYGIADMAIVGRLTGSAGLSAVDSASRVLFLITSICNGIALGGTVAVAHAKGADDAKGIGRTVGTLISLSAAVSIAITVVCQIVCEPALRAMRVPPEAMRSAIGYFRIVSLGTVFTFGYAAISSAMRGLGDSASPLGFVAVSVAANIVLDLLFVGPLRLGTAGAAWATVVSQALSFAMAARRLGRGGLRIELSLKDFRVEPETCARILKTGIPSAAQMAVLNLSYLLVTGMLNSFGVTVAAAAGIGLKVNTVVVMPCWAIGQAVLTMTAQNLGAGDETRVRKAAGTGIGLALAVSAVEVILVQLFTPQLVGLFSADPEVVAQGTRYLRICCSVNIFVYAVMYVLDSLATGAGHAVFAMVNSMIHSVAMRLLLSWLLGFATGFGFVGLCFGESLSPILSFALGAVYFSAGFWRKRRHG